MKIVALAGGVGGAKLADGLAGVLPPQDLTIIANTGDDFTHLGLYISPDLDTICYTLAGIANLATGWGRADETFNFLSALQAVGGEAWFQLGDKDLATHTERTHRLRAGETLTQITHSFCTAWQIKPTVLPMSNNPVCTIVDTVEYGELPFQEYFVHRHFQPQVKGFRFEGAGNAHPAPGVIEALQNAEAVVICPSNPWVSIDPILAVPGIEQALHGRQVVAVSPIIHGSAVKGPLAKMYRELGFQPTAKMVAGHYSGFLSGFIIDSSDESIAKSLPVPSLATGILMKTQKDRIRLAESVLDFIQSL